MKGDTRQFPQFRSQRRESPAASVEEPKQIAPTTWPDGTPRSSQNHFNWSKGQPSIFGFFSSACAERQEKIRQQKFKK